MFVSLHKWNLNSTDLHNIVIYLKQFMQTENKIITKHFISEKEKVSIQST